ncbi:MAG: nucleotidyl transferase AbiEii/AbiGii toxin family protein [Thermoplasmata archaeon]
MRVFLSPEEKEQILSIVKTWRRDQINTTVFSMLQSKYGVPARMVETAFWHVDTLDVLRELRWLVFKGGTCIQSYIDPYLQRVSVDLDFNSKIEHPNAVQESVEGLNAMLKENGRAICIKGVWFGTIEFVQKDERTGTLTFRRRMPSRFGEIETAGDVDIQSKSLRIQINYKHAWLPALETNYRLVRLFVQNMEKTVQPVKIHHESVEDLFADKILAVSNIGPFGRERFKDVYDLIVLSYLEIRKERVLEKLGSIGEKSNLSAEEILRGARNTVLSFSEHAEEASGFSAIVCKEGKKIVERWEDECRRLGEIVKRWLDGEQLRIIESGDS